MKAKLTDKEIDDKMTEVYNRMPPLIDPDKSTYAEFIATIVIETFPLHESLLDQASQHAEQVLKDKHADLVDEEKLLLGIKLRNEWKP